MTASRRFGPWSLGTVEADDAFDGLVHAFLAHSARTPAALDRLLAVAPDDPLAHATKGLMCLLLGRRELFETAKAAHARALAAGGAAPELSAPCAKVTHTDRMRRHSVAALGGWLAGNPSQAARQFEILLSAEPADPFAAKMCHAIKFLVGDQEGMLASAAAVVEAIGPDEPAGGYMRGCYAFALEENGRYAEAERWGREAVDIAADDAWGLHAVAHVYDMQCRSDRGKDWLEPRRATWEGCNNFRFHVWWHYALFELDLGNVENVLALYDREIRRDKTDDYRDIANAVSLLARLSLDGIDVGVRWDELADLCERRVSDGCLAFADLHYLLALLGGGRDQDAVALVERLSADAAVDGTEIADIAASAGAPAAAGLAAFTLGRHKEAYQKLAAARLHMQRIGGSHAQRDVFERITIEAAIRANEIGAAHTLILDRAGRRGGLDRFARTRLRHLADARPQTLNAPVAPAGFTV